MNCVTSPVPIRIYIPQDGVIRFQTIYISMLCLVSVPDPKPTQHGSLSVLVILEAIYVSDEVWGQDYVMPCPPTAQIEL